MIRRSAVRARRRAAIAIAATLGALLPAAVQAQAASPAPARLLFVAASGEYVRLDSKDASPQQGPGAGIEAGLVLRPWLTAFAGIDAGRLSVQKDEIIDGVDGESLGLADHTSMRHIEAGLRLSLPRAARVTPYAEIGYSTRRLHYESSYSFDGGFGQTTAGDLEVEVKGDAPVFGLGIEAAASPSIAFDLGARYSRGRPDQAVVTVDGESFGGLDPSSEQPMWRVLRVRAGLRWYPSIGLARR